MANSADFIAHVLEMMRADGGKVASAPLVPTRDAELSAADGRASGRALRASTSARAASAPLVPTRDAELSAADGRASGRALRASTSARPMFGGHGVYVDGTIVAIVIDDILYLKTDDGNRALFTAQGLEPFVYETRAGKKTVMSYHRAPDEALESPPAMAEWLRSALGAALRSAAAPSHKRKPGSPSAVPASRAPKAPGAVRRSGRR